MDERGNKTVKLTFDLHFDVGLGRWSDAVVGGADVDAAVVALNLTKLEGEALLGGVARWEEAALKKMTSLKLH